MCGIYGFIGRPMAARESNMKNFIWRYMHTGVVRGMDATGWFAVDREKGSLRTHKKAVPGWDYPRDKGYKRLAATPQTSDFVVVHHRASTIGKEKHDNNAHPFQFTGATDRVIGVHNGTLVVSPGWLDEENVDSARLYRAIAEYGLEEAMKKSNGSYALVWYSFGSKKLHMLRNRRRPLHIMKTTDGLVFGSTAPLLYDAASSCYLGAQRDVYQLEPDYLYSWDLSGTSATRKFDASKFTKEKFSVVPAPLPLSNGRGFFGGAWGNSGRWEKNNSNDVSGWQKSSNLQPSANELELPATVDMIGPNYDPATESLHGDCWLAPSARTGLKAWVKLSVYGLTDDAWRELENLVIKPITVISAWEDGHGGTEASGEIPSVNSFIQWWEDNEWRLAHRVNSTQLENVMQFVEDYNYRLAENTEQEIVAEATKQEREENQ